LSFAGTGTWTSVTTTYKPAANVASVWLYLDNSAAGSFWFDDLSLTPTTQLVANGGFEAGMAGWSLDPHASIDTNPADAHSGNDSLQLVATSAYQGTLQIVPVTAGQTYSFSAFGRSSGPGGLLILQSRDASGSYISELDLPFAGTGTWTSVTTTYKPAANVASVWLYLDNSAAGSFWFDDLSLTPN
jgi:hypothetical protein